MRGESVRSQLSRAYKAGLIGGWYRNRRAKGFTISLKPPHRTHEIGFPITSFTGTHVEVEQLLKELRKRAGDG